MKPKLYMKSVRNSSYNRWRVLNNHQTRNQTQISQVLQTRINRIREEEVTQMTEGNLSSTLMTLTSQMNSMSTWMMMKTTTMSISCSNSIINSKNLGISQNRNYNNLSKSSKLLMTIMKMMMKKRSTKMISKCMSSFWLITSNKSNNWLGLLMMINSNSLDQLQGLMVRKTMMRWTMKILTLITLTMMTLIHRFSNLLSRWECIPRKSLSKCLRCNKKGMEMKTVKAKTKVKIMKNWCICNSSNNNNSRCSNSKCNNSKGNNLVKRSSSNNREFNLYHTSWSTMIVIKNLTTPRASWSLEIKLPIRNLTPLLTSSSTTASMNLFMIQKKRRNLQVLIPQQSWRTWKCKNS